MERLISSRLCPKIVNTKFIILVIVSLLLAGCTESAMGFDASISASSGTISDKDGLCGYSDGEECHAISVILTNNGDEDVSTTRYYWEAHSTSGGIFKSPEVIGPDACVGGGNCTLTLKFGVTEGEKLTKLIWDSTWNEMETEIPEY
jgi:hypothetical protein